MNKVLSVFEYNALPCLQCIPPSQFETVVRGLEAAILEKLADRLMQWRPIETAPKDGTEFLAVWNGDVVCAYWCVNDGKTLPGRRNNWYRSTFSQPSKNTDPTHWMPLPPAPAIDAQKGKQQ